MSNWGRKPIGDVHILARFEAMQQAADNNEIPAAEYMKKFGGYNVDKIKN